MNLLIFITPRIIRSLSLAAAASGSVRVAGVGGTVTDTSLVSFPSAGADDIVTLPSGTPVTVTNFTLQGDYFEVTASGQRGFVPVSAVTIGQ